MSKCKTVTLRGRKIKNGKQISLCLDYYPGYRDTVTMKVRTREALAIYIFANPANQRERDYNKRMLEKAEAIRCRRYEAIVNENYGFFDKEKMKGDFLAYFKKTAKDKNSKWEHVYKHFERFVDGKCTFAEIDIDLCHKFLAYLEKASNYRYEGQTLHPNTVAGYWSSFKHLLHIAYRDKKIKENVASFLDKKETIPTIKEHLSQQELCTLAETPCEHPILKAAFLFSCLTGLRKSDIKGLIWENIQPYGDGGMFVTLRMQKTQDLVLNPISDEALELIGKNGEGKAFVGFKDSMAGSPLKKWIKQAGITKKISFHSARHTFASLQVEAGTDIYVVQKLLAHKNVSTTEVYANMADEKKRLSVNKITLKRAAQG
jgi:site-specific recombinase XerD